MLNGKSRAKYNKQLADHECIHHTEVGHESSRTTSTASSHAQSNIERSSASKSRAAQPGSEKRRRSHGQSEKNYRMKLDERFSNLLQILPGEMVERAGHFRDRWTGEESTSKATTLDLAVDHIQNLEAEGRELVSEGSMLGRQVAVYQRLVSGRGGHLQKWAEL